MPSTQAALKHVAELVCCAGWRAAIFAKPNGSLCLDQDEGNSRYITQPPILSSFSFQSLTMPIPIPVLACCSFAVACPASRFASPALPSELGQHPSNHREISSTALGMMLGPARLPSNSLPYSSNASCICILAHPVYTSCVLRWRSMPGLLTLELSWRYLLTRRQLI